MRLILSQIPKVRKTRSALAESAGSGISDGDALADKVVRRAYAAVRVGDQMSDAEYNQPDRSNVGQTACP